MAGGQARPSWRRIAAVVPASGCYLGSGTEAIHVLLHHAGWDWWRMVGSGASGAVGMAGLAAFLRLAEDRRGDPTEVQRAVDEGRLPEDARLEEWLPRLTRHVRDLRRLRVALVALMALQPVLVAAAAVVANDGDRPVAVLAVVLAAFIVVPFQWLARRIQRTIQLLDSLRSAQPRS